MLALNSDYYGESKNSEEVKNTLAEIAKAGFTHVHWCHEWCGDYLYSVYEIIQIKEWLAEFGLKVKAVHATDGFKFPLSTEGAIQKQDNRSYTSAVEYSRLAGVELIQNRVDMARELDAGTIVLHMLLPYKDFEKDASIRDRFYAQTFKSLDVLEPYCRSRHIRICIENLPNSPHEHQVYQFERLFERYDKDFLGLCFDTGHANIICPDKLEFARIYKDRLFMVHIHDNHGFQPGIPNSDEHLIPFSGTFDWDGFARILASSAYEEPYVLEVANSGDPLAFPGKTFKAGEKLAAMVKKYK
jgi:sugar phosphate isomerase/epimerase